MHHHAAFTLRCIVYIVEKGDNEERKLEVLTLLERVIVNTSHSCAVFCDFMNNF